ncbi:LysR family transcriptional regulator [Salinicoccus sp. YB14-2]|uniref:LysR family transcriptional regulator n=1 Tax=Salinicoccus sp. YB14-2 TaxID=1572701 RepID=UPI001E34DFB3|nr:LysR family transcriptional regulator [Salinicoccus sp. YB14-2]
MDLNLYHIFHTTALEQNFSRAADKLFITQPSVSHAIKQLEEKLGVKLFTRTSRGVRLTPEGQTLLDNITPVFGLIDNAEQKLSELRNFQNGHVTIGGSDSTCKHYLLPHIQTFQEKYPEIRIKLQHGSTPEIIGKLKNGMIDISLVHLPINENQIHVTEYLNIHSTFVVGEKYEALAGKNLSLEQLTAHPLISFSETSSSRRFLNQLFQKQGMNVKPDIEVGSVELMIECAKIGMGIAFVTKELILEELENEELFEVYLNENIDERKIGVITKDDTPLSLAADEFYRHLFESNDKL